MFNAVRKLPAPASLLENKSYSDLDVLLALKDMFYGKCYLCESKSITNLNVEHLKPFKKTDLKLKYDWTNLFYVCGRCNNFKRAKYKNILDCTDSSIDVLRRIKHLPPHSPYAKLTVSAEFDCPQTAETAALLNSIFNADDTPNKYIAGRELRKNINTAIIDFISIFLEYESSKTPKRKKLALLEQLQTLANKEQEFSAFIRWVILEDESLRALLEQYID